MRWYDATVPIREGMVVFPGDPPVHVHRSGERGPDGSFNLSHLNMSAHSGTHVDAPAHVVPDGPGVESLALDVLVGDAYIADAQGTSLHLDAAAVEALDIPDGCERLILKTNNSRLWDAPAFDPNFVSITDDCAECLIERGIRLVGIDYLSVSPAHNPAPVHESLLRAGIVILEGLDLRGVPSGPCTLLCLPLLIPGADGAPARVLVGREE